MKEPEYWNHNVAYYPWIKKETEGCRCILDAGCGDGALLAYLDDGSRELYGVDSDPACIEKAQSEYVPDTVSYVNCAFEELDETEKYDAIIFCASIHHMDMKEAVQKAKNMLSTGGLLIIVGLAKPSTVTDHIIEAGRVIPSRIISAKHNMQTADHLGLQVSYQLPKLNEVRRVISEEIPYASWRQALHYRYLLKWIKED